MPVSQEMLERDVSFVNPLVRAHASDWDRLSVRAAMHILKVPCIYSTENCILYLHVHYDLLSVLRASGYCTINDDTRHKTS